MTDVPRSQVYGAADEQFESPGRQLFTYPESVRGDAEGGGEVSEALWLIRGSGNISERAGELIADANLETLDDGPPP